MCAQCCCCCGGDGGVSASTLMHILLWKSFIINSNEAHKVTGNVATTAIAYYTHKHTHTQSECLVANYVFYYSQ